MEVNLEHAHLLASTLMWKRFGDEKPEKQVKCLVRSDRGDSWIGWYLEKRNDCETDSWGTSQGNYMLEDSDLWLYLSDLDVLKVKNG